MTEQIILINYVTRSINNKVFLQIFVLLLISPKNKLEIRSFRV